MSKLNKEQFINECKKDIDILVNVSGLDFNECADMMFITYRSFAIDDMDDEEVNQIIDKLNKINI